MSSNIPPGIGRLATNGKPDDDTVRYVQAMSGPSPAFEAGRRAGLDEARQIAQSVRGRSEPDAPSGFALGWRKAVDAVAAALYIAGTKKRP